MTVEMVAAAPGDNIIQTEVKPAETLDEIADRMRVRFDEKDVVGSDQWKIQVDSEARSGMVRGIQGSVDAVTR